MKLAVTDACIFIDLIELQLTSEFFKLPIEIHTSLDVYNELYPEQKEILKAYSSVGKLKIHNLTSLDKAEIQKIKFPKSLSDNDKTVIYLAEKMEAIVISSDKAVRNFSKSKSIEYHGMLWIFDQIVERRLLDFSITIKKIEELFSKNIIYLNNAELIKEKERRIKIWSFKK
jgi:hypothetical protein